MASRHALCAAIVLLLLICHGTDARGLLDVKHGDADQYGTSTMLARSTSRGLQGTSPPVPCGFSTDTSGHSFVFSVKSTAGIANNHGVDAFADVTLSFSGIHWVIDVTFNYYHPRVVNKSYLQLYIFNTDDAFAAWKDPEDVSSKGWRCDPLKDGLFWFTKWGNTTALSTLPHGSSVTFEETPHQHMRLTIPIQSPDLPWTWGQSLQDMCTHFGQKGSAHLAIRAYNVDQYEPHGQPLCSDDFPANGVLGYNGFNMTCNCPQPPPPASCTNSAGCNKLQACVSGKCIQTSNLTITLTWDQPRNLDVDLFVGLPDASKPPIGPDTNPSAASDWGASLYDDQGGHGPEVVEWPTDFPPPSGTYSVCVAAYQYMLDFETDSTVNFTVVISGLPGGPTTVTGQLSQLSSNSLLSCSSSSSEFVTSFTV